MGILTLFFLLLVPPATQIATDPIPGLSGSMTETRNLVCERMTTEAGHRRYPGVILESAPRGDYIDRSAVVCRERLMRPAQRPLRDEAILSSLEARAAGLAAAADALRPELGERTWLVETYYPSRTVANKIAFAAKNALVSRGFRVSDRVPVLAAGDIDVVARMKPDDAYPLACRRYFAEGRLKENDALLGVLTRDRRETVLHAGVCDRGEWRWLR